ncbi:DUF1365 domain-containing protein [Saccharobesus litoralis]|uniref:DUF1365 domain-containing protein n=1 Tax=Saccharobesus litoralis TaxID=2172099 RepID=A0A2S0VMT6_9ALTE|nr:DUF1365 domain-containing protein [Saccharobesus litoralis]AWB65410.1 DUF1365 domain-containing protein [Saccharobesus litoralis]
MNKPSTNISSTNEPLATNNSGIYVGQVRHRRFSPTFHGFNYKLYMMGLDIDELENTLAQSGLLGTSWYNPIRFKQNDYVKGDLADLKARIANKVNELGGDYANWQHKKIFMLAQLRCLGLFFSPVNFYFCFNDDTNSNCLYMLAEVSNTPWNEKHYYLVDLHNISDTQKAFHVSPFMPMDMRYRWKIKPPRNKALVHIENHQGQQHTNKVFDATMALSKKPINANNLFKTWLSLPAMTLKICLAIYWQALKLFIKRIPFVAHPSR